METKGEELTRLAPLRSRRLVWKRLRWDIFEICKQNLRLLFAFNFITCCHFETTLLPIFVAGHKVLLFIFGGGQGCPKNAINQKCQQPIAVLVLPILKAADQLGSRQISCPNSAILFRPLAMHNNGLLTSITAFSGRDVFLYLSDPPQQQKHFSSFPTSVQFHFCTRILFGPDFS